MATIKRKPIIAIALIAIPPAVALAAAAALGWIRFEWSLAGVGYVFGAYAAWIAILGGLAEIGILPRPEPPGPRPSAIYQAPEPPKDFVGRESKIKRLTRALKPGGEVAVTSVVGMGGVGKTELAKVIAYRVARRFRDGVLWANFEAERPETIADSWAAVLGKEQLPGDDLSAKAAAWRGLIGSKELLLVFDNVRRDQEIDLLRPSYGRNAVLITTRHGDHPALRGVEKIALDQFTPAEAMALAEQVLGKARARAQAADATHLFKLLGYLPLAVSIALYLAKECDYALAYLNGELERAGAIQVLHQAENLRKSLQATFETAWLNLPEDLQLTFRTLTLFNAGRSFSTWALAETLQLEEAQSRARLCRLVGRSLLNVIAEDRWALHPLLREFAASRQSVDEVTHARMAAHYVKVASAADALFLQGGKGVLQGLEQFDAEWPHIQAGQAWAATHAEEDETAAKLCSAYPDAGAYCLNLRLHSREWIAWLEAGADAARHLGDKEAEGAHLGNLGSAYDALGEVRLAIEYLEQALVIARGMGDRHNEGGYLGSLGNAYVALGEVRLAIEYLEQALVIARGIGDRHNEGIHLGNLGNAYVALGEARRAIEYYQQALELAQEIGDRRGEVAHLGNLGNAYYTRGEAGRAIEYYEQAMPIAHEIGDRRGEGNHLANLGLAYQSLGEMDAARQCWTQALEICEAIESPYAERVRGWLAELQDKS
jgi:tetratricopeptide (TPR) repeat protein